MKYYYNFDNLINPADNVYITNDKKFILFDINTDSVIYNLKNYILCDFKNNLYYNYNNSVAILDYLFIYKVNNNFYNLYDLNVDNLIVNTNIKYDTTTQSYIIINNIDNINTQ
jgi:hypothetical protein